MTKEVKRPRTYLFPVPAVLVSCGAGESANIITIAWIGTLCSEPPHLGIGVQPRRHSHGLIAEIGEFVVNLPTADQVRWVDYCGSVSGRDVDKWAACGFTPAPAREVGIPLIAECPVNLECRVRQVITLGMHDLFIAEIVAMHVERDLLDKQGNIDTAKANPLTYLPVNGEYRGLGEQLGEIGFSL